MTGEDLSLHLEALIFSSAESIGIKDMRQLLHAALNVDMDELRLANMLAGIKEKYADEAFVLSLEKIAGGYQFLTKPCYQGVISHLNAHKTKKKLSQAALETLAIIAYNQPVTRLDIEHIRGVNCEYTIQRLLEKELITISGTAASAGKPLLYATSNGLMDYLGINSKEDLPPLKPTGSEMNEAGLSAD